MHLSPKYFKLYSSPNKAISYVAIVIFFAHNMNNTSLIPLDHISYYIWTLLRFQQLPLKYLL